MCHWLETNGPIALIIKSIFTSNGLVLISALVHSLVFSIVPQLTS